MILGLWEGHQAEYYGSFRPTLLPCSNCQRGLREDVLGRGQILSLFENRSKPIYPSQCYLQRSKKQKKTKGDLDIRIHVRGCQWERSFVGGTTSAAFTKSCHLPTALSFLGAIHISGQSDVPSVVLLQYSSMTKKTNAEPKLKSHSCSWAVSFWVKLFLCT